MKKLLLSAIAACLLLLAVMLTNTWRSVPAPIAVEPYQPTLDRAALAARLATAIRIRTLSPTSDAPSLAAFLQLHAQLERDFPRVHAQLMREIVSEASLLYRWTGRERCAPVLLLAHQDVVPVEPGTDAGWTHPPFAGVVDDDFIWGRGAIDDKASLLAIMEAIEQLLAANREPRCDVYLAFGHDEEVGGRHGAQALAATLQQRGIEPAFVLDEGGALTFGSVPGLSVPIATIGVAEKGYLSVRLTAQGSGGHSSMPPTHTAIGLVAGAVARLEARRPAAAISPVQRELLTRMAPHLPFAQRAVMSNLWISGPLVERLFAAAPSTDATMRTTTAPTLFRAGIKDNVLAQEAEAVVNFRIRPGDSVEGVLEHVRQVVDDERVHIGRHDDFGSDPTPASSWNGDAFLRLERALRAVSPEPVLIVAPYVTSGATDARHYAALTPNLYRFAPFKLTPEELASFHGTDERIRIDEYLRAVRFYMALLGGADVAS